MVRRGRHGFPDRISWMTVSCVVFTRTILTSPAGRTETTIEGEVTILHLRVQHTYKEMDTCIHMFG